MKSNDFFCLVMSKYKSVLVGLLCCLALTVHAESSSTETSGQGKELILTLSDKWLEADAKQHARFHKTNHGTSAELITKKTETKPANIGCGMEANPIVSMDNSLASRVVGKCNFNYNY